MSAVEPSLESPAAPSDVTVMEPTLTTPPPRLSLLRWLLLAGVRPVRAVHGSDHFGWLGSWAVHLLGLLLGVVVIAVLPAVIGTSYRQSPTDALFEMSVAMDEVIEAALQDAASLILTLASIVAGLLMIHVGTAVSAITLMAWTARGDEPARASWARAMQRLWRLTPFAAVMVAVMSIATFLVEVTAISWWDGAYWEVEMYLWSGAWLVSMAWPMAVMLWALHPGPIRPRCRWPAACAGCGYTLVGLGEQQTCPECGLAVEQSTEPATRPGVAWGTWRNLTHWWRNGLSAIHRPTALGRSLHLLAPEDKHRGRFVLQLAAAVLTPVPGLAVMAAILIWIFGEPADDDFFSVLPLMTLILGTWTMVMVAGVQLTGAGLLGGLASWLNGRNLLPAAQQGMVCLGGYMLLWIAAIWTYWLTVITGIHVVEEYLSVGGNAWSTLGLLGLLWLAFLALNLVLGVGYLALLWRIIRGARYANW